MPVAQEGPLRAACASLKPPPTGRCGSLSEWRDTNVATVRLLPAGLSQLLGLLSLIAVVGATLLHDAIVSLIMGHARTVVAVKAAGVSSLALLLSSLSITVFWSLYLLTDVVNRKN